MKLKKIISNLSLKEKVSLLSGFDNWYTPELKKYGISEINLTLGYRSEMFDKEIKDINSKLNLKINTFKEKI